MIDFIIPHMGRSELLTATVNSILNQSHPNLVAGIYIITKNKTEPELPKHPKVKIHLMPEARSISEQRNFGVSVSNSDLIAFLDADIELASDWANTCYELLQSKKERVVVSAFQQCKRPLNAIEQIRTCLSNVVINENVKFLPGRNLLCYRRHHEEVGGFPAHLKTCEDYYYTERLSKIGDLFYSADTFYYHLGEDLSLKQTFSKEIWRSEYNLFSVKGRHIPLREWPSILFPIWIPLCLLGALALINIPALAGALLLAAFVPPVLYSFRLSAHQPVDVTFKEILVFYCTYFAARSIGTLQGIRHLLFRKAPYEN